MSNSLEAGSQEPFNAPPSYSASMEDGASSSVVCRVEASAVDSDADSVLPPPFSITPGTLIMEARSRLIHSPIDGARPLYELSHLLDDQHASPPMFSLMHVSPMRTALPAEGRSTKLVPDEEKLYDISKPCKTGPGHAMRRQHPHEVVIHSRHDDQFGVVCLHKEHHISLQGRKRTSWEVITADEDYHPRILYQAFPGKAHGVLEWRDGGGMLVAIDTALSSSSSSSSLSSGSESDREAKERRIEIMISLDKRHLDLIVALWVARMLEDTMEEEMRVEHEQIRRRKTMERQFAGHNRHHGLLHNLKGALHRH